MGLYESVIVNCPTCGKKNKFQSKSGDCLLAVYRLKNCPPDVMEDINRHSPYKCTCGTAYDVDIETRKTKIINR